MASLLYDADCGFCTRSARFLARLGLAAEIRPLQSVDLPAAGVSPERAQAEIPFVADDASVAYGHAAIAGALQTGAWPWRVAGRVLDSAALQRPAAAAYHWVAAHRHQLPGSTAACKIEPVTRD